MKKASILPLIFTIIGAVVPICWDLFTNENKELTIQEEQKIDFPNESFALIHKDSIRQDHYSHIFEYSISNKNVIVLNYSLSTSSDSTLNTITPPCIFAYTLFIEIPLSISSRIYKKDSN